MIQPNYRLKKVILCLAVFSLGVFMLFTQFNSVSLRKTVISSVSWSHVKFINRSQRTSLEIQTKYVTWTTSRQTGFSKSSTMTATTIATRHKTPSTNKIVLDLDAKSKPHNFKDKVLSSQRGGDNFIASRFKDRSDHLNKMCEKPENKNLPNKQENVMFFRYFDSLRVCPIAKVGTTFTKELISESRTGNRYIHVLDKRRKKSFVLVRDPYSRLVSGYLSKIATHRAWWVSYGRYIVHKFRLQNKRDVSRAAICGNDVSFPEFVKYVIDAEHTGINTNKHFTPLYKHCGFCSFQYDFIGHLETIKEDLPYIFNVGNITAKVSMSNEEATIRDKAETVIKQRRAIKICADICETLEKVWWSFKMRGYISKDLSLPLSGNECDEVTPDQFADISWAAHLQSVGKIDKRKQRREALVELFLQVPLDDRLELKNVLMKDFELFGYDPQPPDLFPELVNKTK